MSLAVQTETYDAGALRAGEYPLRALPVVLTGADLKRGAVVGRITSSGKYKLSDTGASDGSETPVGVLAIDADAAGADVPDAQVYFSGEFVMQRMTFGAGHDMATVNAAFRAASAPLFVVAATPR